MNIRTTLLAYVFAGLTTSGAANAAPQGVPIPEDYELEVGQSVGPSGGTVEVPVFLNFSGGLSCTAVSFAVCSDWGLAAVDCVGGFPNDCVETGIVVEGAASMATNGGLGADFFNPTVESAPTSGWTLGIVVNVSGNDTLPPGDKSELSVTTYQLLGGSGSIVPLTLCEIGTPPTLLSVVTVGGDVMPLTSDGQIQISGAGQSFIRGDVDDSGAFSGLVDGLFLLAYAFTPGSPGPACLETADSNGDGSFSGLVDSLYLLNHQFTGGPAPPAPYPSCGADPNPPGLGCGPHAGCP